MLASTPPCPHSLWTVFHCRASDIVEMGADVDPIEKLRLELRSIEAKAATLKAQIAEAEEAYRIPSPGSLVEDNPATQRRSVHNESWPLQPNEYQRYGRQMIMPEIGLEGWRVLVSCVRS